MIEGEGFGSPSLAHTTEVDMGFTPAEKEELASHAGSRAAYVSLHTADPSTTGANEATGGSPAYARKPVTFVAGSSDGVVSGTAVVFDIPAGTYTHIGLWDAVTAGVFRGGEALPSSFVAAGQDAVAVAVSVTVS